MKINLGLITVSVNDKKVNALKVSTAKTAQKATLATANALSTLSANIEKLAVKLNGKKS
jgi:hypothetical protein